MLKQVFVVSAFALSAGISLPSLAQAPATSATQDAAERKAKNDYLSERICRTEEVTGSRLAKRKVCRTRSEWADQQLQDRQSIEKSQTQRGLNTP